MATNITTSDVSMVSLQNVKDAIPNIIRDPRRVQRMILNIVESISNGEVRVADPTSPFALMTEMTGQLASACVNEADTLNRRQYSSVAVTPDDLYYHISDYEMYGIFANPSSGTIVLLMSVDSIRAKAIETDNPNIRKIIIPKHSEFKVADYTFTMQYPIVITVMSHGGITVRYDTSQSSPLYAAENMPIKTKTFNRQQGDWIAINIPLLQFQITKKILSIDSVSDTKRSFVFNDKFCFLRAYQRNDTDGKWTEISVALNKEIHNPRVPTIVAKVLTNNVEISIPQIYFTDNLILRNIRVDIYTTKGNVNLDLSNYQQSSFSATWTDNDDAEASKYYKVLNKFEGMSVMAQPTVSGGSDPIVFGDLRRRVTQKSAVDYGIAITPEQVADVFRINGYDLVFNKDDVTNRQFLATRLMPAPSTKTTNESMGGTAQKEQAEKARLTVTGIGADLRTLQTTLNLLSRNIHTFTNNRRMTVTPKVLYRIDRGNLKIVDHETVNDLLNTAKSNPEVVANHVNASNYLFNPYYMVLNAQPEDFSARFYDLDNPEITSTYTDSHNESTLISVELVAHEINTIPDGGYKIYIQLEGDAVWKKLTADRIAIQLTTADGTNRVWWEGKFEGVTDSQGYVQGNPIYSFIVDTRYDIDDSDKIILSGQKVAVPLSNKFNVLVMVKDHIPTGFQYSNIDDLTNPGLITGYNPASSYVGVLNETLDVTLGYPLHNLWSSSRSTLDPKTFATYETDVYRTYTEVTYKRDPLDNSLIIDVDPNTGVPSAVIEHNVGDFYLDELGQKIIKYPAGSTKYDALGKPIIIGGEREILRFINMVMFDGRYYFANDQLTTDYAREVFTTVTGWIINDVPKIKRNLIDETEVFFQPKTTTGYIKVIGEDSDSIQVKADQELLVTYYTTKENHDNAELRKYITEYTPRILKEALEQRTVSVDGIVEYIKSKLGDDVLSVKVEGFMEGKYQIISLTDDSMLPSIGKRLVVLSSKELRVEDAVTVQILKHKESI